MTVVLLARPPRAGAVLPHLPETAPLSAAESADLYGAMLADVAAAVAGSSDDLLVNYPPADAVESDDPEADLREHLAEAAPEARYEVQVGSDRSARVGNAVTHLLDSEGVGSAVALTPDVPLLTRSAVDETLMRLRRDDVVLGPATEGRVYAAGFREPIDFADAYAAPAVRTLAERSRDAGLDVGFLAQQVRVRTGADLLTLVSLLGARRAAGRAVPERTVSWADTIGLDVVADDEGPRLVRD